MKKIIAIIKNIVKPGPSRRNPLTRTGFRKLTPWQRSQLELLALFRAPQNRGPVPTWTDSLNWLKAVA